MELHPRRAPQAQQSSTGAAPTVYGNQALHEYPEARCLRWPRAVCHFRLPLLFGLLALAVQLPFSIPKDIRRRKEMRYGRRLRGPLLLSPKEFNRTPPGRRHRHPGRWPERDAAHSGQSRSPAHPDHRRHGRGKTTHHLSAAPQIQGRGDAAIVYDPACEFIQQFYDPKRGDIDSQSARRALPYWGPSEELRRQSEAKTLAESLFQPHAGQERRVLHRDPAENLRPSVDLRPIAPGPGAVDVERRRDRPPRQGTQRWPYMIDQGRAAAAQRRARFAGSGRRQPAHAAHARRGKIGMDRDRMGRGTQRLDLHHLAARTTRGAPSAA